MPQPILAKRRRTRRHRVPMPLTESGELFEGAPILRELEGDVAVVLWKSYKNVMLWAGGNPAEREGLFAEGAGERRREDLKATELDAVLTAPLDTIAELLASPAGVAPTRVAAGCRTIAEWAASRGASATELLFMQAAALADPLDAEAAVTVGRLARNRAEYARAETWFRQAIFTARQTSAWAAYSQAFLGLAKVYWRRGALPGARRCLIRGYRAATRHHLHELRGWALQDLGTLAVDAQRWEEAQGYVRSAWRIYGPTHPFAARLAHNVAYAWAGQGWFDASTRALVALGPLFEVPMQRLQWAGSLARASGGAGDRQVFFSARAVIDGLRSDPTLSSILPEALLDLASGSIGVGEWEIGAEAAGTALRLADDRGEARIRFAAEATIESLASERSALRAKNSPAGIVPQPVEEFLVELLAASQRTGPVEAPLAAASA